MNVAKLLTDVPAEAKAVGAFVTGVESAVNTAKASGLTSVLITDLEALIPEGEAVIAEGEAIANDFTS